MSSEPNYRYVGEYVRAQFERGRQALEEGIYDRAIELFTSALRARGVTPEIEAVVRCHLSEAHEEDAHGKEALEAVVKYESLAAREALSAKSQVSVWLRLGRAYYRLRDYPKAISYVNAALNMAQEQKDAVLIGQAHLALGRSYWMVDESQIAFNHIDQAVDCFRQVGDRRLLAQTYLFNGIVNIRTGKFELADTALESAERLISDKPYYSLLGQILQNRAAMNILRQRNREALTHQERAISCFERAGQQYYVAVGLVNLGESLFQLGEIDRAEIEWERAAELARTQSHGTMEAMALDGLGQVETLRGDYGAAALRLKDALTVVAGSKSRWYELQIKQSLARLYLAKGAGQEALIEAVDCLTSVQTIGDEHGLVKAQLCLVEAYLLNADNEEADKLLAEVEGRLQSAHDLMHVGLARRLRARLLGVQNQYVQASALLAQSVSAFEVIGNKYQMALSQFEWGTMLLKSGAAEEARKPLESAVEAFAAMRAEVDLRRTAAVLGESNAPQQLRQFQVIADSRSFSLATAERLLNAVVSRELLLHELISVIYSLPGVKRIATFEVGLAGEPKLIVAHGWSNAEASELLPLVLQSPMQVIENRNLKLLWLGSDTISQIDRTALMIESEGRTDTGQLQVLLRLAQQGLELCALRSEQTAKPPESSAIEGELATSVGLLVGSIAMRQVLESINRIRSSDVTVLITGESGTGKELIARAVHMESARRDKAFVPFNCTTATRELADSLLFGHRRGAFTGASEDRQGVVRAAEGGTLFLDEIGDLALEVQPKLLRFLQEGEVQPLGLERPVKVDVRVVAATNAALERLVEQGRFREDLFHRLNVIRLRVPPLRERREEVPILAKHFLARYAQEAHKQLALTNEAADLLQVFDWPGNVRQLGNEMRRIAALAEDGETITYEHLSPEIVGPLRDKIEGAMARTEPKANAGGVIIDVRQPMGDAVSQLEREMLLSALRENKGNITKTARQLGLTRRGLHLKRERLGIQDFSEESPK